ncbi:MAG TPA: hypothetical protein V6C52_02300 [Coleofasciculaceae cyanobacterium]
MVSSIGANKTATPPTNPTAASKSSDAQKNPAPQTQQAQSTPQKQPALDTFKSGNFNCQSNRANQDATKPPAPQAGGTASDVSPYGQGNAGAAGNAGNAQDNHGAQVSDVAKNNAGNSQDNHGARVSDVAKSNTGNADNTGYGGVAGNAGKEAALDAANAARETATEAANAGREKALDAANAARETATEAANAGREKALDAANAAREKATEAANAGNAGNVDDAKDNHGAKVSDVAKNNPGGANQDASDPTPSGNGYGQIGGNASQNVGGAGQAAGQPAVGSANNVQSTPDVNRNIDFTQLSKEDRSQAGLSNEDRAIDHLWGRQVISRGFQDGGIYLNVLQNPEKFTPAEVALVNQLSAKEQQQYGGINGKELDRAFFDLMQRISPDADPNKIQQYLNAPARFAQGPVNITSNVDDLQKQTGLTDFQQAALRLWGHEPLFNGGKVDGSILAYTIGNENALDSNTKGGAGASVDGIARGLLEGDLASDGVRNGDTLKSAFGKTLDSIYLGAEVPTLNGVQQEALQTAQANGRTSEQITQDSQQGMVQALADAAKMVKDHPIVSTMAVGGIAAATAVCPFLGAMGAGAAGIMAGQQMMNRGAA